MREIRSLAGMQRQARGWQRAGTRVALVPTMGYLHEGHLSLVCRARQVVGPAGVVVLSVYVNPTQFGPREDLARYPRDLQRDRRLCREAGVDVMFVPDDAAMYVREPGREHSTFVGEQVLSAGMEGASRPTHFRGVTTVVAKLFNLVLPEVAVFGAKDFQQAAVVRRMTRDLNFPVRIVVAPTVREEDGLARSSRNVRLSSEERAQAVALREVLLALRRAVQTAGGAGRTAGALGRLATQCLERFPLARLDYVAFFDPETLVPCRRVTPGCQAALAVCLGQTRLIDNERL